MRTPSLDLQGAMASAPAWRHGLSEQLSGAEPAIEEFFKFTIGLKGACAPCFSPTDMVIIQNYTHSEVNGPV